MTKKPAETRMGKGKGNPEFWVAVVKPGRILYEMEGVDEATAKEGFRLAAQKIGIKTKFVTRTPGALRRAMKAAKWREMSDDEVQQKARSWARSSSTCGSSSRWAWPRTRPGWRSPGGIWPGPRPFSESGRCASRGSA